MNVSVRNACVLLSSGVLVFGCLASDAQRVDETATNEEPVVTDIGSGQDGVCSVGDMPIFNKCLNNNHCSISCCDQHDRCFAQNGCSASSWLQPPSSLCQTLCNKPLLACLAKAKTTKCSEPPTRGQDCTTSVQCYGGQVCENFGCVPGGKGSCTDQYSGGGGACCTRGIDCATRNCNAATGRCTQPKKVQARTGKICYVDQSVAAADVGALDVEDGSGAWATAQTVAPDNCTEEDVTAPNGLAYPASCTATPDAGDVCAMSDDAVSQVFANAPACTSPTPEDAGAVDAAIIDSAASPDASPQPRPTATATPVAF